MTKNIMNIGQTMEQLNLDRDETGDIIFLVESQRIRAHRSILAAHSPRYKAQFYGTHSDSGEIPIPHVTAAAFNVFLQFFYKQTVDLTMENIRMVLDLAKQSLVDEFVESCGNFLKTTVTAENLFDFYGLAVAYDIASLRLYCEQQISTNTMHIFRSNDFLQCDRDELRHILKMDALNCNETDVFAACIAWARAYCMQNGMHHWKPENLRAALGDVIHQIRFSSITAEEFADLNKSLKGFFTADECIEIQSIIDKLVDFKPQKFNGIQKKRSKEFYQIPDWLVQFNRYWRMMRSPVASRQIIKTDRLNFYCSCDKPIRLHGIAFDFPFHDNVLDDFPSTVAVELRHDNDGPLISFQSKYKVLQDPKKKNETIIMFDKPIDHIVYFSCSFRLPSLQWIYGPELQSSVQLYSINFSLYGGSVSRFFFDTLGKIDGFLHDYGPFVRSSKKFNVPIYELSSKFFNTEKSERFIVKRVKTHHHQFGLSVFTLIQSFDVNDI